MTPNERDPVTCGWSIGFDGVWVCRLCMLPCPRVKVCPQEEKGVACGMNHKKKKPSDGLTETEVEVVMALARHGLSAGRAAKAIFRHRNTVMWHSEQVRVRLGLDPLDFYDMIKLEKMAKEAMEHDDSVRCP